MHLGKKYNIRHNTRDFDSDKWNKDGHIDQTRSCLNKTLVNTPLRDFFDETFGKAISDFNEKNKSKHPERCTTVSEYFQEQKSKVQETILQMGDHDTYQALVKSVGQSKADNFYQYALKKVIEKWQKENPSLKVFGAYIHMDEIKDGTPHAHIDFLPIAVSDRGLTTKVSLDGALKEIGFARSKEDKYNSTPYKRWLADRRKSFEQFFQEIANEQLGKGVITILPSEPATVPHQDPWEHREVKKGLELVKDFFSGKGKKKVAKAEEIIANSKKVNKALCEEGNQRIATAKKREAIITRREKATENLIKKTDQRTEQLNQLQQELVQKEKFLKAKEMIQDLRIEKEVQNRIAPNLAEKMIAKENERYLQKRRSIIADEIEYQRKQIRQEQQRKQEIFERARNKKLRGDFEERFGCPTM